MDPKTIAFPLLLTDCSAPGVRAGILGQTGWLAYINLEGETGSKLFEAVKLLLKQTEFQLEDIQSFAFCEGPGSTLGIRINSMALRTWLSLSDAPKPIYAYRSLVAASILIGAKRDDQSPFTVLSDLRKNNWNGLKVSPENESESIQTVTLEELSDWPSDRFYIQQRIHSPGVPPDTEQIDYDLKSLGTNPQFLACLRPVEKPDIFQTTKTEFKKWTPSRHR